MCLANDAPCACDRSRRVSLGYTLDHLVPFCIWDELGNFKINRNYPLTISRLTNLNKSQFLSTNHDGFCDDVARNASAPPPELVSQSRHRKRLPLRWPGPDAPLNGRRRCACQRLAARAFGGGSSSSHIVRVAADWPDPRCRSFDWPWRSGRFCKEDSQPANVISVDD